MDKKFPFIAGKQSFYAITISHQFGSGGYRIGQALTRALNFVYLDHELMVKTADTLGIKEDQLLRKDRNSNTAQGGSPVFTFSEPEKMDTEDSGVEFLKDADVFKYEAAIINKVSAESSCIILGRCGSYILKHHPNHVNLYIHADLNHRCQRIAEKYGLSEAFALKLIQNKDEERLQYIHNFAKEDLYHANLYDLAINTSKLEPDKAVKQILYYLSERFNREF